MAKKKKMQKRDSDRRSRAGSVALDWFKIDQAIAKRGLAWTSEKPGCLVSRATWQRLSHRKRISREKAVQVAAFLSMDLSELLVHEDAGEPDFDWPQHPEWEPVEESPGWSHTSNGLSFYRCKVKHRYVGGDSNPVFGRARVYDLTRVPDRQRAEMVEYLTRHPLVCRRLAQHRQFPANLSALPVRKGKVWWVVDEWIDGKTLTQVMSPKGVEPERLSSVMRQVAEALQILHHDEIVLRELSPDRVLIGADDRVQVTELDLAKLRSAEKTVSADWPKDPYRAPEVESGAASRKSDYFSWALIYLHAATGDSTLGRLDFDAIDVVNPSPQLKELLSKCLLPMPTKRPNEILSVLE